MNYPIGDFITRLKNAAMAEKTEVIVPYSQVKEEIAHVLVREGYLSSVRRDARAHRLFVSLAWEGKKPLISGTKNISRPGLRIYAGSHNIPMVPGGVGVTLVSTSKGITTGRNAREKGLGGEIIAQVW